MWWVKFLGFHIKWLRRLLCFLFSLFSLWVFSHEVRPASSGASEMTHMELHITSYMWVVAVRQAAWRDQFWHAMDTLRIPLSMLLCSPDFHWVWISPVGTSHSSLSSNLVLHAQVWALKEIWLIHFVPSFPSYVWEAIIFPVFFIVFLDLIGVYNILQILNEHVRWMQEFLLALFLWC